MSIVQITHHDENIYNVTKRIASFKDFGITEGRFVSECYRQQRHARRDPRTCQKHGTMGVAHIPLPDPSDYLRKGTGKPPMNAPELMDPDYGHHKCSKTTKAPLVPLREETLAEQDKKLKYKKRNLIRSNIEMVLNMKPKPPARMVTVSNRGVVYPLHAVEPNYIYVDQFSALPGYLDKIIREKERHKLKVQVALAKSQPKCRYVTRDRREKLLNGLKANWNELQRQYQLLPILTDTIPKINRKAKLEAELKQLEKDIVLIERHQYIYVYNDDLITNGD